MNYRKIFKATAITLATLSVAVIISCKSGGKADKAYDEDDMDQEESYGMDGLAEENDASPVVRLEGNTLHYGDHLYTLDDGLRLDGDLPSRAEGQVCTVTFTHFPATVKEFRDLYDQLMGTSYGGVLALNVMAYEMYRRDRAMGEEAIRLVNTPTNATTTIGTLAQKFPKVRGDENDNDSYHQPYLVAAFLEGATHDNKYQPAYPYVLRFRWSTNPYVTQHEYSNMLYGYIYNLVALRNGENECAVSVLSDEDNPLLLKVSNCPSFYYAVPNIRRWDDTLK